MLISLSAIQQARVAEMEFAIVSYYISFLCVIQYSESFTWTVKPANLTFVTKGEDKSLTWKFTLTADEQTKSQTFSLIQWKKFNQTSSDYYGIASTTFLNLVGTPSYYEPRAPHIEIVRSDQATLLIKNVRTEDEGTYKIEYSVQFGGTPIADHQVNVTFLEPPEVVVSNDQDVCEGSSVTLSCNATGKPTPNITWTKEGENGTNSGPLPSVDGVYVISNSSRSSNGTYRCTASNGVGDPVNQTTKVIVGNPSSVDGVFISSNTAVEGYPYHLSCEVSGVPVSSVSWIKVTSGERHAGKLLNFTNISRNDTGNYTCEASNRCGNDSKTEAINVFFGPEITQFTTSAVHHKVCQYGVIIFNCAADACPPVTSYQLFENDIAVLDTNTSGMWSRNMSTRGVFMYKCVANNTYGTGISETIPVRVYVPPSIQEIDNLTITEGSDMTLTCQISGDPPLEQFWIKPDGQRATTNVLTIKNITNGEAGEYRCEATNDCGTVSRTACVDVQFKPENVTLKTNTTNNYGCSVMGVKFTCHSSEANPPVHNYILIKNNSEVSFSKEGTWMERISREETFVYKCVACQQVGNVTSRNNITLTVGGPPAMEQVQNATVIEGTDLTKECSVTAGTPPLTVFWKNVNSGQVIPGKLLNITNITRYQKEHRCIANNSCGSVWTTMFIYVQYKPAATYSSATIRLKSGEDGSIDCPVDIGNPPAVITWYKGNHTNCNKIATNSTLKVQNASSSDEGRYTCFAKNALGNTTISLLLLVVKPVSSTVSTPFQTTPAGPEEYNCRSNNVLFALIGVLAFIILLLVIYIIWLHRKGAVGKQRTYEDERGVYDNELRLEDIEASQPDSRTLTQPPADYMDLREANTDNREAPSAAPGADYAPLYPLTRSWEVPRDHVTIEKIIGKGSFGQVAKGTAVGLRGRPETTTVAIKMLKCELLYF
ncbi:hemicentin-1-like [Stylophora pistillata]|uniref:hemicentin-1-like n=1 Tax=Stylophora pistillata TaxID=50429 RepID=UPI000C04B8A0|nr:hemicentin-1-like [Stylophora pistillata]